MYEFFPSLSTLLWLSFWALVLWGIWSFLKDRFQPLSLIGPTISPIAVILSVFLTITIIFLFGRIWDDLSLLVTPAGESIRFGRYVSAQVALDRLFVHTLFVVPVVILAIVVYQAVKDKHSHYGALTLPYFIGALLFTARLLWDTGDYVLREYHKWGIYMVLIFLVVVFSGLIFYIQQKWEERQTKVKKEAESEDKFQKNF
jgi:branched-subunit amino acid transport protein AzlD